VFELHLFPRAYWPALFRNAEGFNVLVPYLIFHAALSMVGFATLAIGRAAKRQASSHHTADCFVIDGGYTAF
jgi:hypothetical protein